MITTRQAIEMISIINKMEIKDAIVNIFKQSAPLETRKKEILREMLVKSGKTGTEVTEKLTDELFNKFPDLAKEYNSLDEKVNEFAGDIIMTIILAIPKADNEFYKFIGEIKGISKEDAENLPLPETANIITSFFSDGDLMGFLSSFMK